MRPLLAVVRIGLLAKNARSKRMRRIALVLGCREIETLIGVGV